MYKSIYVPVDNSEYSNQAVKVAINMGNVYDSTLTGNHVYAAKMHDYRFKQMEFTLPEEYLQESEIQRQRKIHDSLITMGLKLISDCYLNDMKKQCDQSNVAFVEKLIDGKHTTEIVNDMKESNYDLTVLGALGIGKMKNSQIGTVCQQVARHASKDVWVIKHLPKDGESERDTILVGIDGSPQSFGGLMTAIDLAKKFDKKICLIGVYDPYLHYQVFNSIVDVLTEKAAKVFRFEEQNQLHEEIIDTGLAQIYQSHLDIAEKMAQKEGINELEKVLLDGKAFQKILDHSEKNPPWLLILGRIGVHSEMEYTDLGSNTENLLRLISCDILLNTRLEYPELDLKAEESILWTKEAEERMSRVPTLVKGIARTGILRLAIEEGHSVITNSVVQDAMDRFMPKQTQKSTMDLAESLAFENARNGNAAMCKKCGITAAVADPVKCPVCGGTDFDRITSEMVQKIVDSEGGVKEEKSFDGRNLKWTQEARGILRGIEDAYQKRRAKAYIEKTARLRKKDTVTKDLALEVLEETGQETLAAVPQKSKITALSAKEIELGLKIIATDFKGAPLKSVYEWSKEASQRVLRVPAGFMRDQVQERVEKMAMDQKQLSIDLLLVEKGIEQGRQMMAEMIQGKENLNRKEALNEVGIMAALDKKRATEYKIS